MILDQIVRSDQTQVRDLQPFVLFTHIIIAGHLPLCAQNAESDEADDGCYPHQTLQPSGQLPGKLHILRRALGRLELVGAVTLQDLLSEGGAQPLDKADEGVKLEPSETDMILTIITHLLSYLS